MLLWLEAKAPDEVKDLLGPGYTHFNRAEALLRLGLPGLACLLAEEATRACPSDADYLATYLHALFFANPDRAYPEASAAMDVDRVTADVAAACINILSGRAASLAGPDLDSTFRRVLDWCEAFERAPDRAEVSAKTLALVRFNQGLAYLRLDQVADARRCFAEAHHANPVEPAIEQALDLDSYDGRAREIAAVVHGRTAA